MPKNELDLLDRKIMYELDLNARQTASQLARKVRRSKETVNFRMKRLLADGWLKGFYGVFNTSKLGEYYYKIYLKFKNTTPKIEEEIVEYIGEEEQIVYLASIEGYYDCICLVMCRNADDMLKFFRPFMKRYGGYVQEKEIVTFLTTHRLNAKFLYAGTTRKDWHYPVAVENFSIDDTDRKILKALSGDARLPLTEIAKRCGVDAKVVKYRMKKLEDDGIILAYVTAPDFDRIGRQFVQLNLSLNDPTAIGQMIEYFDSTNTCLFALEMLGKYDLAVELHVQDSRQLKGIIDGFREKFTGKYNDYDVSTITKEHVVMWGAFA